MKYIDLVEVYNNVYEINQVTTVDKCYGVQTKFTVDINEKTYHLTSVVDTDVLETLKFASCFIKDISDTEAFVKSELQRILSVEIARDIDNIITTNEI